jgi:hypothetical protein
MFWTPLNPEEKLFKEKLHETEFSQIPGLPGFKCHWPDYPFSEEMWQVDKTG